MLVPARLYTEQLNEMMAHSAMHTQYDYYHISYAETTVEVEKNFWSKVQLVSLNADYEVCGYFKADISRPENCVNDLYIINFNLTNSKLFATDLVRFFKYLMANLKIKKINFSVIVGNPTEASYDRLVDKLGGRVVGTKKYNCLIKDHYYDLKMYEIINNRWECNKCDYITNRKNGPKCKGCGKGEMVYIEPFKQ